MNNLKQISILLLLVIPINILYSQNIKDVPKNFKKDLNEYLESDGENDNEKESTSLSIDPSLYTKFRVPEFSSKKLRIGSDEILHFNKTGGQSSFGINIDGDYEYFKQSTYTTLSYSIKPTFHSEDSTDQIQLTIPLDYSKYFFKDYSGLHGFGSTDMDILGDFELLGGVGYGRVTSVRPIARAVALASKVGNEMTNDDIIAIANIITKQNDGYYENKYKSDAKIIYYNELSTALNAPTETMFIQQIMEDPAFSNISDRKTGWQARVGYSFSEYEGETVTECNPNSPSNCWETTPYDRTSDVVLSADYAKPIGFDRQLLLGLETDGEDISLTGSYTIDHSVTWVSGCYLKLDETISEIEIKSTKNLINKIYTTASLKLSEPEGGDTSINFYITFNYFAF